MGISQGPPPLYKILGWLCKIWCALLRDHLSLSGEWKMCTINKLRISALLKLLSTIVRPFCIAYNVVGCQLYGVNVVKLNVQYKRKCNQGIIAQVSTIQGCC